MNTRTITITLPTNKLDEILPEIVNRCQWFHVEKHNSLVEITIDANYIGFANVWMARNDLFDYLSLTKSKAKTASKIASTLNLSDDPYDNNILHAALKLRSEGKGEWTYETQWGSGMTLWRNGEGETVTVAAEFNVDRDAQLVAMSESHDNWIEDQREIEKEGEY